ncbi:MAG: hypothetical protein QOI98_3075 [Solirubrobacteraceae bacterium]|nr:hypothetical protein [Solirubrobacteraceae bacterium]
MARPDRGVAQRFAAKKRRKRLLTERPVSAAAARGPRTVAEPPVAERMISEVPSRGAGPRVVLTSPSAARPGRAVAMSRRPFTAYAEEYRYVVSDLRRVALVAGSLLLAVILLFFILR